MYCMYCMYCMSHCMYTVCLLFLKWFEALCLGWQSKVFFAVMLLYSCSIALCKLDLEQPWDKLPYYLKLWPRHLFLPATFAPATKRDRLLYETDVYYFKYSIKVFGWWILMAANPEVTMYINLCDRQYNSWRTRPGEGACQPIHTMKLQWQWQWQRILW